MKNLIKSELFKLKYDKNIYFISSILLIIGIINIFFKPFESGYASFTGQFKDMIGIFACSIYASLSLGSEFTNRTINKKVIIGHSRKSILFSKLISYVVGSIVLLLVNLLFLTVLYSVFYGFRSEVEVNNLIINFLAVSFFNLCLCSISFFISFTIKESGKSTAVSFIIMALIIFISQNPWLVIFDNGDFHVNFTITIVLLLISIIFINATYYLFRKCELR